MSQYNFADTKAVENQDRSAQIVESITFGDFSSAEEGWWLVERSAPSPNEKEIVETIPYMQGVFDFSSIDNERFFDNREITYQLRSVNHQYADRKIIEQVIKQKLMANDIGVLYDSHDQQSHWIGKCKSVIVNDSTSTNSLIATIIFDCYPFAVFDRPEGDDDWDSFSFENGVAQDIRFKVVNEAKNIVLINAGSRRVDVVMTVTGNVSISGEFGHLNLEKGRYTDTILTMARDRNEFELSGVGTISFEFYREVMI